MSKTKEALELAIDIMSKYQNGWIPDDMVNALLTCKEALAEQQKPLSDAEIIAIADSFDIFDWMLFARAIERAHGIGE